MNYTSPDIVRARAKKAGIVINHLIKLSEEIEAFENNILLPAVASLKNNNAQHITKTNVLQPQKVQPDSKRELYKARKLVDLYMNDDVFYKKYKLSDIAKKTKVSMSSLRIC